jgi:NAD-dependent SIR2 family protein deacetylase
MPADLHALAAFAHRHPRLLVLTGAGCSTDSGIPDYRDAQGQWKRAPAMTFQAFTGDERARQRYWARSLIGWRVMSAARPGPAHQALARLEAAGRVELLLTQNVDGLRRRRQPASSTCTGASTPWCAWPATRLPRTDWQALLHAQSRLASSPGRHRPRRRCRPGRPGLLHLPGARLPRCGTGMLKPDVVFFGENVPRERVDAAMAALQRADALLVAGSSLMVYSGYRFAQACCCRQAHRRHQPGPHARRRHAGAQGDAARGRSAPEHGPPAGGAGVNAGRPMHARCSPGAPTVSCASAQQPYPVNARNSRSSSSPQPRLVQLLAPEVLLIEPRLVHGCAHIIGRRISTPPQRGIGKRAGAVVVARRRGARIGRQHEHALEIGPRIVHAVLARHSSASVRTTSITLGCAPSRWAASASG